jgi:hypothetical protein
MQIKKIYKSLISLSETFSEKSKSKRQLLEEI